MIKLQRKKDKKKTTAPAVECEEKMKKRMYVLATLMLSASILAACGKNNAQANNPGQPPNKGVEHSPQQITPINQASLQNSQGASNSVNVDTSAYIGEERALSTALEHAGVANESVMYKLVKLDYDDGIWAYDVEFYAGTQEYDYKIDASTGTVLSYDYDMEGFFDPNAVQGGYGTAPVGGTPGGTPAVSLETAQQTALAQVPGATANNIRIYADYDDGRMTYEGKIIYNNIEYDFSIDANTGNILEWEAESIYH